MKSGIVLKYHLVDSGAYHPHELADFSTVGTSLDDTRIHVEPRIFPTPSLVFNFYSRSECHFKNLSYDSFCLAVDVVVRAKNGYIYLVNAPLLPPLPPLAELFILPGIFSTLTSGVQKAGLDLRTFHKDGSDSDDAVHPAVWSTLEEIVKELPPAQTFTVFAPTNGVSIPLSFARLLEVSAQAFKRLGWELNAFLFSPFTNKILKGKPFSTPANCTSNSLYSHSKLSRRSRCRLLQRLQRKRYSNWLRARYPSSR